MKTLFIAAALCVAGAATAGTNVSISVGQPGFYGRINVGDFPQPQVMYAEPVIVQQQTRYVGAPIYLRVPPGHEKHWEKHCAAYNACGQHVYFVRDDWYGNVYAPHYREREMREHGHDRDDDHGHGHGRGHDKHHGHND